MHQPQGFVDQQHPNYVCPLCKSLYGLKQAPRAWFERFSSHQQSIGFEVSSVDQSLLAWLSFTAILIPLLYVDDIIITANNSSSNTSLIWELGSTFAMKDLGYLHYFLGIEVHRTTDKLFLSHTKYAVDLLQKFKMDGAKPISTPMVNGNKLSISMVTLSLIHPNIVASSKLSNI